MPPIAPENSFRACSENPNALLSISGFVCSDHAVCQNTSFAGFGNRMVHVKLSGMQGSVAGHFFTQTHLLGYTPEWVEREVPASPASPPQPEGVSRPGTPVDVSRL